MSNLTLLLQRINCGEVTAQDELWPLVYDELRQLAMAKLAREAAAQTLQPTALVHEAWLRLGGDRQSTWQNRRHFFGAAAEAMRRILIDRARRRQAERHGGNLRRVTFDELEAASTNLLSDDRLLALADALERLREAHPEKHELVQLRYFAGLTLEEIAATLDISHAMAKRWWTYTRSWLLREIERTDPAHPTP